MGLKEPCLSGDNKKWRRRRTGLSKHVLSSVPGVVSSLKLDNNGSSDSLQASWVSPDGAVDVYLVTLSNMGSTPRQRRLSPNITHMVFGGLTPGRSYELSVTTTAGGQSTETRTSGRTGGSFSEVLCPHCSDNHLVLSLSDPVHIWFCPSSRPSVISLHVASR